MTIYDTALEEVIINEVGAKLEILENDLVNEIHRTFDRPLRRDEYNSKDRKEDREKDGNKGELNKLQEEIDRLNTIINNSNDHSNVQDSIHKSIFYKLITWFSTIVLLLITGFLIIAYSVYFYIFFFKGIESIGILVE